MSVPKSAPTGARAEARRRQIVEAAIAIVRQRGMAAASVRAVAEHANIGASTMRYYFPSQVALNSAIAGELLEGDLADLDIVDASLPPVDRLMSCLGQFLPTDDATAGPALQQWLTLVQSALVTSSDDLIGSVYSSLSATSLKRAREWLTVLADEGHLERASIPSEAVTLLSRIDGLSIALLNKPYGLELDGALRILRRDVDALLAGGRQ